MKKTVVIGISGGVDSALSAYLLKKQNYKVIGVFFKPWSISENSCDWYEDYNSAMRVCAFLNIPFLTRDYSDVYKQKVIDNLIYEYKKGNTPNPDILCNKQIKFHFLSDIKNKLNIEYIATGHYVSKIENKKNWSLYQARDKHKDQSYFLWAVKRKDLKNAIFPIGNLKKSEVRKYSQQYGIPSANRPDSVGLCFVGNINFMNFLRQYIPENEGNVLNTFGEKIGRHPGSHFFTIGQRHGFETYNQEYKTPLIVVQKDQINNTITVSEKKCCSQYLSKKIKLENENYFEKIEGNLFARIRHTGALHEVEYINSYVIFKNPILLASGQSLVLYDIDGKCFGGGIIRV